MLQERFLSFIKKKELISPKQKVLLAVSGGADSVAMAYLFYKSGLKFGIAHCNFKLRGIDSDKDEAFVKNLSQTFSVSYFSTSFNTFEETKKTNESIQMTARKLRYEWLEEIRKKHDFDIIATAHHHDDNIETLLINILRGTGIKGLCGIPLKNKSVIRPLLFAAKKDIEQFIQKNKILYREDNSNKEDKYTRNLLRNNVIPIFENINPDFRDSFNKLFENIELPYKCFLNYIEEAKSELLIPDSSRYIIPLQKIKQLQYPESVLYETLKNFGFKINTIKDIVLSFEKQSGKVFYGKGYTIVKDREHLILCANEEKNHKSLIICDKPKTYNLSNFKLQTEVFDIEKDFTITKKEQYAYLDYDKLQFPLKLRLWQHGDSFQPLGMIGRKKISDFLIDKKMSLDKKEEVYVLCSGKDIVWVAGYRIDERFKIEKSSKRCFFITLALPKNSCI